MSEGRLNWNPDTDGEGNGIEADEMLLKYLRVLEKAGKNAAGHG